MTFLGARHRQRGDSYWQPLARAQFLEISTLLSSYLLSSQGDRMAMANSVEGRYPFLDYRVIEFAATLPHEFKIRGLNEKYVLKRMMKDRLPDSVLKRPKQPYRSPVAASFFSLSARDYTLSLLSEHHIKQTGLFEYQTVQKLLDKIMKADLPTEMENMGLSGIVSTQLLYHQYILKDSYRPEISLLKNCRTIFEQNPDYC